MLIFYVIVMCTVRGQLVVQQFLLSTPQINIPYKRHLFKTQIMLNQMDELKKKERHLGDINKQLKHKLGADGASMRALQGSWRPDTGASIDAFPNHSSNMDTEPTLHIGRYHQYVSSETNIPRNGGAGNSFMSGWAV